MRQSAPAAMRNREPIAEVLREELPDHGTVLEIASGTGEHALYFAQTFPHFDWQPSDPDPDALRSIAAWREDALAAGGAANLREPLALDVRASRELDEPLAAILCINMIHISPPDATEALFGLAGRLLGPDDPLLLYGPFIEEDEPTAASNIAFDRSLKDRDPQWGLRRVSWLDELAGANGLVCTRRVAMPANNLVLIYRRMTEV